MSKDKIIHYLQICQGTIETAKFKTDDKFNKFVYVLQSGIEIHYFIKSPIRESAENEKNVFVQYFPLKPMLVNLSTGHHSR